MKKLILILLTLPVLYILFSFRSEGNALQNQRLSNGLQISLSGHINGEFIREDVSWSRIQNPLLASNSTFGLFTDPPSAGQAFDVAMVLGNIGAAEIVPGEYGIIPVKNDVPALVPPLKGGFMTIVPTGQRVPREEFYTQTGTFTVDTASLDVVSGSFNVTLANVDSTKFIQAEGTFYQRLK